MLCTAVTCVNTDFIPRVALNGKTFTVLNLCSKGLFCFFRDCLGRSGTPAPTNTQFAVVGVGIPDDPHLIYILDADDTQVVPYEVLFGFVGNGLSAVPQKNIK